MYLSRLNLNPRSRQVQRDLADPYQLHRTVLSGFPTGTIHVNRDAPGAAGVLYRLDEVRQRLSLLVQSQQKPRWDTLPTGYLLSGDPFDPAGDNPAVKRFSPQLTAGQRLQFRLRANPTKRLGKSAASDKGKRVGIYNADDQLAWLQRKAERSGFRLLNAGASNDDMQRGTVPRDGKPALALKVLAVRFDGQLQVTDPELFVTILAQGIGSGKAWGCGLLSLAPAQV